MKIFVFAYDRYETMTTSKMLQAENIEHKVLCHTQEAANLFQANGTTTVEHLHITNKPKGLAYQRNSALDLMEEGEWALFLVDDLKAVTELRNHDRILDATIPITQHNQSHYAERFKHEITMRAFVERAEQLAVLCDKHNCYLGGFAGINNPLYRKKHYSVNVLADGRAWVIKKSDLRFDENAQLIDDLCFTALNIKRFGIVIVNQWVLPDCKRYTTGAFGSINQRMKQKKIEVSYLVKTYPQFIRVKDKAGWEYGSHAVLKQTNKPKIKIVR